MKSVHFAGLNYKWHIWCEITTRTLRNNTDPAGRWSPSTRYFALLCLFKAQTVAKVSLQSHTHLSAAKWEAIKKSLRGVAWQCGWFHSVCCRLQPLWPPPDIQEPRRHGQGLTPERFRLPSIRSRSCRPGSIAIGRSLCSKTSHYPLNMPERWLQTCCTVTCNGECVCVCGGGDRRLPHPPLWAYQLMHH